MNRRTFARALAGSAMASTLNSAKFDAAPGMGPIGGETLIFFNFSIMLWTIYRDLSFTERLEKVAAAGYRSVELVSEFEDWSGEDYGKRPVTLVNPQHREGFLADVRSSLEIAKRLECPTMIVMSGNNVAGMTHEVQHASIVEGLKRAAEIVDGTGVTLLLENIDLEENSQYFLWSVPEAFNIVGMVGHPQVKFLYDFYHAQISGGNLIENLEKNIDKVGLVHIADVPGRHEPGTGEINYTNIYKKLAELKYSHYVAMEYIPRGNAVESLRAAREAVIKAVVG
jgi:hydroxypyruvate isomerase